MEFKKIEKIKKIIEKEKEVIKEIVEEAKKIKGKDSKEESDNQEL